MDQHRKPETPRDALDEAIAAAASQAHFAKEVGVKPPTVHGWLRLGRAPKDRCWVIERKFGVRCERLRPDLGWTRDGNGDVTGYFVRVPAAD